MYEDRVEILNPGELYGVNKLEKLGTATVMESRNPTIVRILEDKGSVIENRHSGIPTMKREMKKYNLPEPEFYEERGSFKVVFRNFYASGQLDDNFRLSNVLNEELIRKVLEYCVEPKSSKENRDYLEMKSRQYISTYIIHPLIKDGRLGYINPNNIRDKNQKYITIKS